MSSGFSRQRRVRPECVWSGGRVRPPRPSAASPYGWRGSYSAGVTRGYAKFVGDLSPNPFYGPVLKLGDFVEEGGGGFAGDEGKDDDFAAGFLHGAAFVLVDTLKGVIAAFDPNVGLGGGEELEGGGLVENAHGIDASQGGNDAGAIGFGVNGAASTLQLADSGIAIDPYQKGIPLLAGSFEVGHVAEVEDVKTAVGHD